LVNSDLAECYQRPVTQSVSVSTTLWIHNHQTLNTNLTLALR